MKPWKRIDPTTTTKVGWRTIVTKTFIMSDGTQATFDTFCPEGQQFVAVIGLTPQNKVIVVRQFRFGPEKVMDELPGGFVDGDESPETAARREFQEETGYQVGTLEYLGSYNKDTYMNAEWLIYFATNCQKVSAQKLEIEEHIEIDLLPIDTFIQNAKTNKMTDAVAVLMALDKLNELS